MTIKITISRKKQEREYLIRFLAPAHHMYKGPSYDGCIHYTERIRAANEDEAEEKLRSVYFFTEIIKCVEV
jgi:hypothetical protein